MLEQSQDNRHATLAAARAWAEGEGFLQDMALRLAIATESPRAESASDHLRYLQDILIPQLGDMGFETRLLENPALARLPALFAQRIEDPALPTILIYGHGDVLWGMEGDWHEGLSPWVATLREGKLYGRGAVDNKGQHCINLKALELVVKARGRLGFNAKILIEMGEEAGSPGLADLARNHADLLKSDVLIASDGPRISADQPTLFLGARGSHEFSLICHLREGAYHSGNWGGLLPNAGLRLAHALASITDPMGKILVPEWRPPAIAENVKAALDTIHLQFGPEDPLTDDDWGEPDLQGAHQVLGWCNFEVLAFLTGRPHAPVNAIPGHAEAHCQLRFVTGICPEDIVPALRRHLARHGFADIEVVSDEANLFRATRTDPDNPWTRLALRSIEQTLGRSPALAPNFGGALPNEVFADILGLPTIWIPHSHPACGQHAPNEHMLISVASEGARIMAGLFWDIGDGLLHKR